MRIAVLGLGEAGGLYAEALAATGSRVAGYNPVATTTPAGVRRAASIADAVAGAELVIGLTGAAADPRPQIAAAVSRRQASPRLDWTRSRGADASR